MIAVYKSLNSDCVIERKLFNLRSLKKTYSHTMKLDEKLFNLKLHKEFFAVRAVRMWNSLPHLVVSAESLDKFKNLSILLCNCNNPIIIHMTSENGDLVDCHE